MTEWPPEPGEVTDEELGLEGPAEELPEDDKDQDESTFAEDDD